ncbi:threonine synthase [Heliorestis acidaminivorans]|uniref:Threonine synthase n=1 Tax=Heliorestis acidaminivorans TaxID=553427 RepID=A0A6I0EXT8_9FIRM|nr:threonine synthase [Heliorestis acidaminivorans]KAB2954619.1 threonine synthase [Heliorestis acidaminivorans]
MSDWQGIIPAFKEFLPVTEGTPMLTLKEGNTPLLRAPRLSEQLGVELYFKFEGMNPTGSFKDRGMVMAVAKAVEEGAQAIMCASTGNTSAAAAAYAARCGIKCIVLIPEGKIALGKLAQALIYGAKVISIEGNFDEALKIVRNICAEHPVTLVNSVNPYRIEGQKTAAFEVCQQLGDAPDYLAIPVGNAGNITAYWKGFVEWQKAGKVDKRPKMIGFEAEGAAAIVYDRVIEKPETVATAIRIGNPASWEGAVNAAKESGGLIDYVTDEEILAAYRLLASQEGIFCEPASAASLAGVIKKKKEGLLPEQARIVCVLTGHGLKDPDNAIATVAGGPIMVPATEEAVLREVF